MVPRRPTEPFGNAGDAADLNFRWAFAKAAGDSGFVEATLQPAGSESIAIHAHVVFIEI